MLRRSVSARTMSTWPPCANHTMLKMPAHHAMLCAGPASAAPTRDASALAPMPDSTPSAIMIARLKARHASASTPKENTCAAMLGDMPRRSIAARANPLVADDANSDTPAMILLTAPPTPVPPPPPPPPPGPLPRGAGLLRALPPPASLRVLHSGLSSGFTPLAPHHSLAASRRLQLGTVSVVCSSTLVMGSVGGLFVDSHRSMAPRSNVYPVCDRITGSRNSSCVMGHRR
mmetsp:Transcript_2775/g.6231  ORF Transcript_2775/g.6231 Transcript_2775/m.6231 type:complete len:231 (+) Transcript_2775:169-861(+)